ncbi:Uncharacterised protein [Mycobacteroides abscessus subsp. massiliense]|uniref:hypothetical protein n=1 Tax=Mycobacteroides abscessus TaxID=36809 RepID=UPI0002585B8F|nr:hypothetical protein [Mycobacteroides abscessus]EIC63613.1 hypothetical protein OUW_20556 [Mycobacteroides abscessus M93]SKN09784.1 Uncharacterised protein [Mycobacteroides abscessus subsp. massiliense]
MTEEQGWQTIQVSPVAPGIFVGSFPVVALLLQEYVHNPKETRVVMAFPDASFGKLVAWETSHGFIKWSGAWKKPADLD